MALLLSLHNYLQAVADDTGVTGVYAKMWLNLYTTANDDDHVFMTGAAQEWSRHKFLMLRTQEEYLLWMTDILLTTETVPVLKNI